MANESDAREPRDVDAHDRESLAAVTGTAEAAGVIAPGHTFTSVTEKISSIVLTRPTPLGWWAGFGLAFFLTLLLFVALSYLTVKGVGIWGNNIPVAWAFDITNLVWWIGIGHAGTLISAILLLLKQTWRTSINRFAEAMTLFAVACAAMGAETLVDSAPLRNARRFSITASQPTGGQGDGRAACFRSQTAAD